MFGCSLLDLLKDIAASLRRLVVLLEGPSPADLEIKVSPINKGGNVMKFQLKPKSSVKSKAVASPITLTGNATIELVVVDDLGNPVTGVQPSTVTTTLTSDNPAFVITASADNLHWGAMVAGGTTGLANVTATLSFNSGTPGPFTASIAITLAVPQVPADLTIIVTPS